MKSAFTVCIALPLLLAQPALAEEMAYTFTSGNWEGGAYSDDISGSFSHCAMSATYKSGDILAFAITKDYELMLGLANASWQLEVGNTYRLSLQVDNRHLGVFDAKVTSSSGIHLNIGNDRNIYQRLRRGYLLQITTPQTTFDFYLTGTANALPKVLECVRLSEAFSPRSRNPFVARSNPFEERRATDENNEEDTIRILLEASGFENIRFLSPSEIKQLNLPEINYVWQADDVFGFAVWGDTEGKTDAEVFNEMLAAYGSNCPGDFVSGIRSSEYVKSYTIKTASALCRSGIEAVGVQVLGIFQGRFGFIVGNLSTDENQANIIAATENMKDLLIAIVSSE